LEQILLVEELIYQRHQKFKKMVDCMSAWLFCLKTKEYNNRLLEGHQDKVDQEQAN
jgi:hypothetical protein